MLEQTVHRIVNTAYEVKMDEKVNCKVMCTSELKEGDAEKIMQRVSEDYFVHLLADNLPAATRWELDDDLVQVTIDSIKTFDSINSV